MNCEFSNPVDSTGAPASGTQTYFAFSTMVCTDNKFAEIDQYVGGSTGSTRFYMQNTISIGDILIIIFLILFFCALIFKLLWNFVWKDQKAKL